MFDAFEKLTDEEKNKKARELLDCIVELENIFEGLKKSLSESSTKAKELYDESYDKIYHHAKYIVELENKNQLRPIAKHMRNLFIDKGTKDVNSINSARFHEDGENALLKDLRYTVEEYEKKVASNQLQSVNYDNNDTDKKKSKLNCAPVFFQFIGRASLFFKSEKNPGQKVGIGMAIGSLIPLTASGITALTSLNTVTIGAIATKVGLTFAATATITVPLALLIAAALLLAAALLVFGVSTAVKACNERSRVRNTFEEVTYV